MNSLQFLEKRDKDNSLLRFKSARIKFFNYRESIQNYFEKQKL